MIDAHIHLIGKSIHPDMIDEGERLGTRLFIGSSLLDMNHYPNYDEVFRANEDIVNETKKYSGRLAGYCYINPRHGQRALNEFLKRIEDDNMVGLKLWVATLCNESCVFPLIEQAIVYRVPVLIHAFAKSVGQLP